MTLPQLHGSTPSQPTTGPLAGLRVIDWTHVLAGPFAGYQLALLGADVVRIERTQGDDMIRANGLDPELAALGLGEAFVAQGAGKRSLALDVRDPRAHRALAALIADADVLIENFRPGKLAALGFDPAALIQAHPRLVVCSITGYGPRSARRAYDHVVQAASGLMTANADAQGVPRRVGFPLIDYAVGQQAALAVTTALYRRDRPGGLPRTRGEWLQVSMQGAAVTLQAPVYASRLVSGLDRPRSASTAFSGNPLSGTFEAADGWLAIVCNAPEQGEGLMHALAAAGVAADELAQLQALASARDVDATQALLSSLLRAETAERWCDLFDLQGVPAMPVRQSAEAATALADEVAWPRVTLPTGRGQREVAVPGIGFQSTEPLTPVLRAPARRGADTRDLLLQAGIDADTVRSMLADGVAWEPGPRPTAADPPTR